MLSIHTLLLFLNCIKLFGGMEKGHLSLADKLCTIICLYQAKAVDFCLRIISVMENSHRGLRELELGGDLAFGWGSPGLSSGG